MALQSTAQVTSPRVGGVAAGENCALISPASSDGKKVNGFPLSWTAIKDVLFLESPLARTPVLYEDRLLLGPYLMLSHLERPVGELCLVACDVDGCLR